MTTSDALEFYAEHSPLTDPGPFAPLLDDLPRDLAGLHQIVQNVYIHVWKIRKYHPDWLKGRTHEYESRSVAHSLALVMKHSDRPLNEARPEAKKLIVDCRHHAVLLCALLRQQGVAARVRCGFATYLEKTHYQDHWVCEYWDGERWRMEDPDLVKHDVTAEEFITGGRAWQMIRSKQISDMQFGFGPGALGEWAMRYDLPRDLAALNKYELLSGDSWGLMEKKEPLVTSKDRALLDEAARWSTADNTDFAAMRHFYEGTEGLRVLDEVNLYNYIENKTKRGAWDDRAKGVSG
ncbi:MAG: transglutaminase domain-containing protein [Anaerolineae bacterium]